MAQFGKKSLERLVGVHPDLVRLMKASIINTPIDFTVDQGVRTSATQQKYYSWGRTVLNPNTGPIKGNKLGMIVTNRDGIKKKSEHQPKADGYGHAVDIYAYYNGKVQFNDDASLHIISKHIKAVAKELNINICWKAMKEEWKFQIVEKYRKKTSMVRSVWRDKEVNSERWTLHLKELFNGKVFNNPKPEETIARVIEISTNVWDIVLDYHLWSGTTCSVAHKMGRQYIGVEQMDYIETIAVERMKKVIEWEQWGISKVANRKGW